MRLYTYFRSSAAYRVRIALNLKGIKPDMLPVHLLRGGGEQKQPDYLALNPQGLVPALEDEGVVLTQSLAIIEYLDETHPLPPLLPPDAAGRARVRAIAQSIACEIHPLNNLRVLDYLTQTLGVSELERQNWYRHWVLTGFAALETRLARESATGAFCHGDTPTLADCCVVPQIFNARRFELDLSAFPTLLRIDAACQRLAAFADASPARQPDAM